MPAREIMILAIALGHPALLERHCEELAATEFAGAGLGPFRDALLAAPAEALQSPAALGQWLTGAGRGDERERILALGRQDAELVVHEAGSRALRRRSRIAAKPGLASAGGRVK